MPSRKRDKGKARKENAAAAANGGEATSVGNRRGGPTKVQLKKFMRCHHGRSKPSDSENCARWMRAYKDLLKDYVDNDPRPLNQSSGMRIGSIDPLTIFGTMWLRIEHDDGIILVDEDERATIARNLSALGTEINIRTLIDYPPMSPVIFASQFTIMNITTAGILFIENGVDKKAVPETRLVNSSFLVNLYLMEPPKYDLRALQPKMGEIMSDGGGYARAKFLSKRTPCSCMKEFMVFLPPKQGTCYHCGVSKPAEELMVCSRCRSTQYCSKSCQKAHWPEHKYHCSSFTQMGISSDDGVTSSRTEYFTSLPVPETEGSSFAFRHSPLR